MRKRMLVSLLLMVAACGGKSKGGTTPDTTSKKTIDFEADTAAETAEPAVATGDVKETIRTAIRQHRPQIQACYEEGLTRTPELAGTVTVNFAVNGDGTVASSTASGLGDPTVETCIANVVQGIQFARTAADGGGVVEVHYPFVLQQS